MGDKSTERESKAVVLSMKCGSRSGTGDSSSGGKLSRTN